MARIYPRMRKGAKVDGGHVDADGDEMPVIDDGVTVRPGVEIRSDGEEHVTGCGGELRRRGHGGGRVME